MFDMVEHGFLMNDDSSLPHLLPVSSHQALTFSQPVVSCPATLLNCLKWAAIFLQPSWNGILTSCIGPCILVLCFAYSFVSLPTRVFRNPDQSLLLRPSTVSEALVLSTNLEFVFDFSMALTIWPRLPYGRAWKLYCTAPGGDRSRPCAFCFWNCPHQPAPTPFSVLESSANQISPCLGSDLLFHSSLSVIRILNYPLPVP